MRVESSPGEGTRFHLYIPVIELAADMAGEEDAESLQGNAERVLAVAEEAALLSLLNDTLDAWGYQVHASQSGTAALQWIEAGSLPDLVVLDADMNLFTAERTVTALTDRGYAGAVIMLASKDHPPAPESLPPLPRLHVLGKPFSTGKLLHCLRQALVGNREHD
jgi:DNA-binding NtrC family response regulator